MYNFITLFRLKNKRFIYFNFIYGNFFQVVKKKSRQNIIFYNITLLVHTNLKYF